MCRAEVTRCAFCHAPADEETEMTPSPHSGLIWICIPCWVIELRWIAQEDQEVAAEEARKP